MPVLLIDSLSLLHRAYYAVPDLTNDKGEPTGALFGISNMLLRVLHEFEVEECFACFDRPEKTARAQSYEDYKATRSGPEEDLIIQIERSKEMLQAFGFCVVEKPEYEADDIIGTLAKKYASEEREVIIVSSDTDLLQLVDEKFVSVALLRHGKKEFNRYFTKEVQERYGFGPKLIPDYKAIAGDASDNIPGVKGIGEKGATELLQAMGGVSEIYSALENGTFSGKGFKERTERLLRESKEVAFLSKDLATIHTDLKLSVSCFPWKEGLDQKELSRITKDLGFTSLEKKLYELVGGVAPKKTSDVQGSAAAIALWVLDSDETNTSEERVLQHQRTKTLDEALEKIEKSLKEQEMLHIWKDIEEPLIPILKKMKETGVYIDKEKMSLLQKEFSEKLLVEEKEIYKLAGKEFNINSPKQLGEILFDDLFLGKSKKTSKGNRSTREEVLQGMVNEHPIIKHILTHRHYKKLLSTYIEALPKHLDENSRLHTTLIQNGTVTGRFSSKDPNLQNIPATGEDGKRIRETFEATPGWKMLAADYSQMELRIAAILSQDENLLDVFVKGRDVHTAVAARMFQVPEDKVSSGMRGKAKAINFGILYGMGVQALKKGFGADTTLSEAQKFLDDYHKAFPKLISFLNETKGLARANGYVETAFGRKRIIEGVQSKIPFVRAQGERFAINAPIQGTAADVIKIAMIAIDKKLDPNKAKMILQVHDELLFEVRPEFVDETKEIVKEAMEGVYPFNKNPIPLCVSVFVGDSWGALKG